MAVGGDQSSIADVTDVRTATVGDDDGDRNVDGQMQL